MIIVAKAKGCGSPIVSSWWWIWFLSGAKGEQPLRIRMTNTFNVSKTGTNNIATATAGALAEVFNSINWMANTDTTNPPTSEPVSPMNIDALWIL